MKTAMKKPAAFLPLFIALAPAPSHAQEGGTFTVTPAFSSAYMFRGARQTGPSFQPEIDYEKGPWAFSLWGNFPVADKTPGSADPEVDLCAYYAWEVSDRFKITPGLGCYTFPRAVEDDGFYKYTIEPTVTFEYAAGPFAFSLTGYYDLVLKGPTAELGVGCTIPVKKLGFGIELSALAGHYDWSDGEANLPPEEKLRCWGDYFEAGIALPFDLSDSSKLTVGWLYSKGRDSYLQYKGDAFKEANPDAAGRGVFSLSYSFSF